jgi:hypothetical protein
MDAGHVLRDLQFQFPFAGTATPGGLWRGCAPERVTNVAVF